MKTKSLKLSSQMRWNNANRDKLRAHAVLRVALRRGEIKRGRCAVCGSFRVDGHHHDYSKPLDVVWLCRRHHQQHHVLLRAGKGHAEAIDILRASAVSMVEEAVITAPDGAA